MYGNRISLISKSQIRYNGILHDQVSSMGTEGRRGNSVDEIPASKDIYEYIQFRATDVLSVQFETDPVTPVKAQPPPPNDPAVLERMQAAADRNAAQAQAESPAYASVVATPDPVTDTESVSEAMSASRVVTTPTTTPAVATFPAVVVGRGGYQPRHGRRVEIPESDFDFESSNSKLNKDELAKDSPSSTCKSRHRPYTPLTKQQSSCGHSRCHVVRSNSVQATDGESQQNFETFGQTAADLSRFRYNRYHREEAAAEQPNNPSSNANSGWRGGRGGRGGFNRVDGHNTNNYRGGYTHHNTSQRGSYNGSGGHYQQQQQQQQQNAESSS
ncbi:hypothetical protein BX661DRAFT_200250 [Kickxella alabastrina]|uniref:uncharacterized protein n=1 Tax=Kickxella alabastrina TaxID=61397 RepID=UPI002221073C|nr:uncharacterized protein BX661DRAFT_200250 [Kickxella alabastrina]KAI7823148.1 hypothetical protein BX661DRAFT_200250 [Kickxella alabastrina]